MDDLNQTKEKHKINLKKFTIELIKFSTWFELHKKTKPEQTQLLVGWLDLQKKIGKGTGKHAIKDKLAARKKLNDCRNIVPVWIMPLKKVFEQFDPTATKFDIIIIDEASQSDIEALVCFYMARKIIIVGDHEQVTPVAVGEEIDKIENSRKNHLPNIPNKELYDGKYSIYHIARQAFSNSICLKEHFRCVPEIIEFSNKLSYDNKIKPLRDTNSSKLKPALISYAVSGINDNKTNEKEAYTIVSLILAAIEQPEYKNSTFGVITLVGNKQDQLIETILRKHLNEVDFVNRKILCGSPPQFQGDERDVIFLSMVDSTDSEPLRLREDEKFKQRYNVAVSRAANQLWVVYSLNYKDYLKENDLRRRLLEYIDSYQSQEFEFSQKKAEVDSPFETAVLKDLISAGFNVEPQKKVGAYKIDLVVDDGKNKLAVECDGEKFHTPDNLDKDLERQAILERLGWNFFRIRGSDYFRNPEETMSKVYKRLDEMGIQHNQNLDADNNRKIDNKLIDKVKKRAVQILDNLLEKNQVNY